ncbi:MAG: Nif3-like dinuclear metal center hexameric protein [Granulicella sp.]
MKITLTLMLSLVLLPIAASAQTTLTAGDAFARIQKHYAAAPPAHTVDTLKAGDPETPVTGIATTMFDTMDVLREAARRGDNVVIAHEPSFYNHRDDPAYFADDPVYKEKLSFIQQHHMVVFRLHDEIHSGDTDHILEGVYEALGWQRYPHPGGPISQHLVTIPPTTLGQLAVFLKQRLNIRTLRVVGDPNLSITHVALLPGASGLQKQVFALRQPVEVLIAGESSEWETVEYVRDAAAQGRPKALILLGHQASEEPGMEQCAKDLRVLIPSIRVDHIVSGEPFWNSERPPATK